MTFVLPSTTFCAQRNPLLGHLAGGGAFHQHRSGNRGRCRSPLPLSHQLVGLMSGGLLRARGGQIIEDMKVTTTGYDFRPAHAAMQRYVDGNLLSGFSSAVLVGRDLVDVQCIGWADKE